MNEEELKELYRKANENDDVEAQVKLGKYQLFDADEVDYEDGVRWFTLASEKGNPEAQYLLGTIYQKGWFGKNDDKLALSLLEASADQEYIPALNELGECYELGKMVPRDYLKAFEYYKRAALKGSMCAQYKLGLFYIEKKIFDIEDYTTAKKWFELAAKQEHYDSLIMMGSLYKNGHGVERDYKKANEYFRKAAERGLGGGEEFLGFAYLNGEGVEKSYEIAALWFTKAANAKRITSLNILGFLYENGLGVDKSNEKALECYEAVERITRK